MNNPRSEAVTLDGARPNPAGAQSSANGATLSGGGLAMDAQQLIAFRDWYNAQYLGDRECGQYIPHNGDPKYTEYMDGYTLALGAWAACLQYNNKAANE